MQIEHILHIFIEEPFNFFPFFLSNSLFLIGSDIELSAYLLILPAYLQRNRNIPIAQMTEVMIRALSVSY
jgi:hypothetical protein